MMEKEAVHLGTGISRRNHHSEITDQNEVSVCENDVY